MTWRMGFVTVHPKFLESYRTLGVLRAAEANGHASFTVQDLRDFAADKHGSIDASPYGGGDGMVMRPDCLAKATDHVTAGWQTTEKPRVVLTSPSGKLWSQATARAWAEEKRDTIFICGRFGGVDQRFIDTYVTDELSIGDIVLAGGELPVLMMVESALRFVPGVLGNNASAEYDSFGSGMKGLLEYPLYTRPPEWNGVSVPAVLQGGNHDEIARWRERESIDKTKRLRPDLVK